MCKNKKFRGAKVEFKSGDTMYSSYYRFDHCLGAKLYSSEEECLNNKTWSDNKSCDHEEVSVKMYEESGSASSYSGKVCTKCMSITFDFKEWDDSYKKYKESCGWSQYLSDGFSEKEVKQILSDNFIVYRRFTLDGYVDC